MDKVPLEKEKIELAISKAFASVDSLVSDRKTITNE